MGNPHSAGSLKDTENKWRMLKSFELPVLTLFAFRWPWAIQKFWKSLRRSQRWVLYSGYYVMIIVKVRVCDFNERLRIFDWQWTWDIVFPCMPKCKQKYGRNAFKIAELAKPCGHCGEARRRPIWPNRASSSQVACIWQTRVKGATGHWVVCGQNANQTKCQPDKMPT